MKEEWKTHFCHTKRLRVIMLYVSDCMKMSSLEERARPNTYRITGHPGLYSNTQSLIVYSNL